MPYALRAASIKSASSCVRARTPAFFIEHAFRKPPEESRHAVLQDLTAWRKQRRAGSDHLAERHQVVFVSSGAMQDEQRPRLRPRAALKAVSERELGHHAAFSTFSIGGSAASLSRRCESRNGGSLSSRPSVATGSSTAKPGRS